MSASMSPTRWPRRASATARFAETVDFPTPPLPDETATTCPRLGSSTGVGGGGTAPGAGRAPGRPGPAAPGATPASVTLTRTAVTPATPWIALRASRANVGGSAWVRTNVKVTCPRSSTATSFTIPAERTSWLRRGFCSWASARSTRACSVSDATGRKVLADVGAVQRVGSKRSRFPQGWAVGYWLIPFVNLVRAYQTMKDLWLRSESLNDRDGYDNLPAPAFLTTWWGVYWTWAAVERVFGFLAPNTQSV